MSAATCIMAVKVICTNNILKATYQCGLTYMGNFPTLDTWPYTNTDFILIQKIQQYIYRR